MRGTAAFLDRWYYQPAPATRLGLVRILVGTFALAYLLLRYSHLTGYASFSDGQFEPVGPVALLTGPVSSSLLEITVLASILAGAAFVAGWRFSVSGPIFAFLLLCVLSYGNSFGQIFHTENLLVLHVIVLALSPAADALALDAKPAAVSHGRYGWPLRLMCVLTVLTYFISGMTKLQNAGLDWVTTDVLRNYIAYDNLRKAELGDAHSLLGARLVAEAWLFKPLAALTLLVELGAPLALFSRRIAASWVAAAWGFHAGILALMAILFPYPLLGLAFLPFFRVDRAYEWMAARVGWGPSHGNPRFGTSAEGWN